MTKLPASIACAAIAFAATAALADETRAYDFTGFDEIEVEGVYEVEIEVGPDFSVSLSGDAKRLKDADVRLEGDVLILGQKKRGRRTINWNGDDGDLEAVVTLPYLEAVRMSGVGAVRGEGIDADTLDVRLEGVGNIELSGTCGDLTARVKGVGALEAEGLECEAAHVTVEGVGSAEVFASRSVDAEVSGMGSIEVFGEPEDVERSGSFLSSIDVR